MKSSILILPTETQPNTKQVVEQKLEQLRSLRNKMKTLEAEDKLLMEELKELHFNKHDKFINDNGETLATYTLIKREDFDKTKFKIDHEDVYELYKKTIEYYQLRLK